MKTIILENDLAHVWDYEMILDKLDVKVVAIYKSWKEFLPRIRKDAPDFVIVDLFLENNEKGLDFVKEIESLYIPTIICTGYPEPEFRKEALASGVRAFFSKPIDKAAFAFEVQKIIQESKIKNKDKFLVARDKRVMVKVPYTKIYKIEIEGNYSLIYTVSKKKFILKVSLKKLLPQLDSSLFMRCHRSAVVNVSFIESLDSPNNIIGLSNGEQIVFGNKFKNDVKALFK